MKIFFKFLSAIALTLFAVVNVRLASADNSADAKVYFKNLTDGAVVTSPVSVQMGAQGIEVAPAGVSKPGQGHHHIIVDGGPIPAGETIAVDATHLHFGKAQTETTVALAPGKHTLTLQFADGMHKSFGPKLSATVHIEVKG